MFYICIATLFLPYPVILVALFDIFGKLPSFGLQGARSWVDTFLPLIVPAFFGNPFYIFLMRQFMLGIPRELSDAARVDGASEIQTFWRVILPLTKPAIVVVAIFAAVGAWNEFLLPLLYLQDDSKYPLAVGPRLLHQPARCRVQPAHGGRHPRRASGRRSSSCSRSGSSSRASPSAGSRADGRDAPGPTIRPTRPSRGTDRGLGRHVLGRRRRRPSDPASRAWRRGWPRCVADPVGDTSRRMVGTGPSVFAGGSSRSSSPRRSWSRRPERPG